jgi:hypothetical protein
MTVLTAVRWDDDYTDSYGVYVLGTHDITAATPVAEAACRIEYGTTAVIADRTGRWRLDEPGDGTDPRWIEDPAGEPAVQFTAIHDPEDDA